MIKKAIMERNNNNVTSSFYKNCSPGKRNLTQFKVNVGIRITFCQTAKYYRVYYYCYRYEINMYLNLLYQFQCKIKYKTRTTIKEVLNIKQAKLTFLTFNINISILESYRIYIYRLKNFEIYLNNSCPNLQES